MIKCKNCFIYNTSLNYTMYVKEMKHLIYGDRLNSYNNYTLHQENIVSFAVNIQTVL